MSNSYRQTEHGIPPQRQAVNVGCYGIGVHVSKQYDKNFSLFNCSSRTDIDNAFFKQSYPFTINV